MFYDGPVSVESFFGAEAIAGVGDAFLVGDNLAGDVLAYVLRDGCWTLLELDHVVPETSADGWVDIFAFVEATLLA